jgi:hypothetical protein
MAYPNEATQLFTLRAPTSATAPSLPILFHPKLQNGTAIVRTTHSGEPAYD